MIIHFVCRGNTYRSRLAETYLNSKSLPGIKVISSGIQADRNICGPITWYAQRIIQKENLQNFEKPIWQKTTKELLNQADFTVFIQKDIYDYCTKNLGFNNKNFEVWDIKDLVMDGREESEKIKETEKTFKEIKQQAEKLIVHLKSV